MICDCRNDWRKQLAAIEESGDVGKSSSTHLDPRLVRSAPDMRRQNDIFERRQPRRNERLIGKDIQARARNRSRLEGIDERRLINDRNAMVKQTLDRARRADIALIGIGDSTLVRMGWFSPEEIVEARLAGAIGDMMCYDFINIAGAAAHTNVQNRMIGLTITDLHRIPDVIAIASEANKVAGILGALRTGAIKTLATSLGIAQTVLNLDEATKAQPGGP